MTKETEDVTFYEVTEKVDQEASAEAVKALLRFNDTILE